MKIMIFVLDDLTEDNDLNKILMKVYKDWNNMYLMSRYKEFSKKDLENFEVQKQDIVTKLFAKLNQNAKIIYPFKFNNLIWKFNLNNAQEFINEELKNNNLNSKLHFELNNLLGE
ncbi:zn-finger domain-containing protein [Gigaspora margarita]|uniref:Zn-finger domain-containing protein n=1 Tax=Gigaspora margarita TaxID=4874 RepID=A0A8H3XGX0_GIGMA|nr:zn-finger domain-containing protein [Gigaspora margarita]